MKISVALRYYDGAEFIEEQLVSILNQFGAKDELILSVDRAFDASIDMLKAWEEKDPRVFVTMGPGKGIVKSYEHAIKMCSGDLIFLSGQDDIWLPDKVRKVKDAFQDKEVMAVVHNAKMADKQLKESGHTLFEKSRPAKGVWRNLWNNSYKGSCMAFRKELLPVLFPIPEQILWYDFWIGIMAEACGRVAVIEEPLLICRQHKNKKKGEEQKSLFSILKCRLDMLAAYWKRKRKEDDKEK